MWGASEQTLSGGGGGFLNTTTDSPSGDKQGKGRRSQNIMPVTCKQLLNCKDDTFKLEGIEANVITIVGLVRKVESSPTKMSMWIDDMTGTIECVNYVGNEEQQSQRDNSDEAVLLCENSYGRIVGALRTLKGNKYIIIFKATPITDLNELTCHLMETIQNGLKLKKLRTSVDSKPAVTNGSDSFGNSMIASGLGSSSGTGGGGGGDNKTHFNRNQRAILDVFIRLGYSEQGVHKDEIVRQVSKFMGRKDALDTLEFLSNEGHIFSTIDDDHFSSTDQQMNN